MIDHSLLYIFSIFLFFPSFFNQKEYIISSNLPAIVNNTTFPPQSNDQDIFNSDNDYVDYSLLEKEKIELERINLIYTIIIILLSFVIFLILFNVVFILYNKYQEKTELIYKKTIDFLIDYENGTLIQKNNINKSVVDLNHSNISSSSQKEKLYTNENTPENFVI